MKIELQNQEQFSNLTGKKTVTQLTGCKKPNKAGLVAATLLTGFAGVGAKKYKAKLKAYNDCISNYKSTIQLQAQSANTAVATEAKKKLEEAEEKIVTTRSEIADIEEKEIASDSEEKFLGMPKNIGIGVTVAGSVLLLSIAGVVIYKLTH